MGSPLVWVPGLVTLGCCMDWEFCCALALPWGDVVIVFVAWEVEVGELKPGMVVALVCAPALVCPAHLDAPRQMLGSSLVLAGPKGSCFYEMHYKPYDFSAMMVWEPLKSDKTLCDVHFLHGGNRIAFFPSIPSFFLPPFPEQMGAGLLYCEDVS